jgi:hypothetical protein
MPQKVPGARKDVQSVEKHDALYSGNGVRFGEAAGKGTAAGEGAASISRQVYCEDSARAWVLEKGGAVVSGLSLCVSSQMNLPTREPPKTCSHVCNLKIVAGSTIAHQKEMCRNMSPSDALIANVSQNMPP